MIELHCPHCDTSGDEHEAGRCLDAWVARDVMGLEPVLFDEPYGGLGKPAGRRGWYIPPVHPVEYYSTDIAAAWEVWAKLSPKYDYRMDRIGPELVYLSVSVDAEDSPTGTHWFIWGDGPAPLAICRAALKAMGGAS